MWPQESDAISGDNIEITPRSNVAGVWVSCYNTTAVENKQQLFSF